MITKSQAVSEPVFHENHERGGKVYTWRRNGKTQTWVTRPDEFRIPVKYGLRNYGQITELTADQYHAVSDCPDV